MRLQARFRWLFAGGAVLLLALVALGVHQARPASAQVAEEQIPYLKGFDFGTFIENVGQWDEEVQFRGGSGAGTAWFTPSRIMYLLVNFPNGGEPETMMGETLADDPQDDPFADPEGHAVEVQFIGANENVQITPSSEIPGTFNWLVGLEEHTGARAFQYITYEDLYDGIDATFGGSGEAGRVVKSLYKVAPGADPNQIVLQYAGHDDLRVDENYNLVIETPLGNIVERAPYVFQMNGGTAERVHADYQVTGNQVRFKLAAYDPSRTLYIDPSVIFSRRFGGNTTDYEFDMKETATTRYFGGVTFSANFPTTSGTIQPTILGTPDWYVASFNFGMTAQNWGTFLGSSSADYGGHLHLLANGNIIVAGFSLNAQGGFGGSIPPIPLNTTASTTYQAVVYEMNSAGTARIRSARFGGNTTTYVGNVEVNPSTGDIYVVGETFVSCTTAGLCGLGPAGGFQPVQTGLDTASGYATRLNANMDTATAFTYLAGNSTDGLLDVKIDAAGNVYLAGPSFSTTFPFTTNLIGPGGGYDFLIAKLNSTLSTAAWNPVRMGGASTDMIIGFSYFNPITSMAGQEPIEIASNNDIGFVGATLSTNFPTAGNPFSTTNPGNYAYVVGVLAGDGSAQLESTYIGGSSTDYGRDIGFSSTGNIWVTGGSASANFPVANAVQAANAGNYDYVTVLFEGVRDTSAIIASTYWGGLSTDIASDIIPGPSAARARISGDTFLSTPAFPDVPAGSTFFGTAGSYDGGVFDLNVGGANVVGDADASFVEILPFTHNLNCATAGDGVNVTLVLVNNGLSDQNDNPGPEFLGEVTGPGTVTGCTASSGTCTLVGTQVEWNGAIPSGGSVSITVSARFNGGVPAGSSICIGGTVFFDSDENNTNDMSRAIAPFCAETNCPPTVNPNIELGCQVHLPILNFQGQDDICRSWIEVQYLGCEPAKAVLITWGEPGFCPPQAAGPLKVECTGMLVPGSTWNILGSQIPTGSKSGILFKFTALQLSDVGLDDDLGFDDVVADLMCEELFFGVVGDADDYRRFKKAYNEGGVFRSIPQDIAMGDGALAVEVLRHCPGDVTPGVEVSSKYNGIAGVDLGTFDPIFGGFSYYVPLIYADRGGLNTVMYIQNGGLECSSVEVWFKQQDDCLRARICEILTLAPGESYQFDATECVGADWQGSAWIRSSEPMGIAVDIFGRDIMMTYTGEPGSFDYIQDPTDPFANPLRISVGNQVLYGPLTYSEYQGWDAGIQIQNLSAVTAAKVKIYFYDRSGDVITTLVDWICPRGSQTFFLPVVHDLPGSWVGSVRAESQEWWTPGTTPVDPPDILGVVQLLKYNDAARTETVEGLAYNMLPEFKAFDWQVGFGGGGFDSGVGLIAVPSLLKDLEGQGVTSEIAIANLVTKPGFTDFAIWIFDQNGLLDYVCQKLHDRQVEYIDLQTWGYVNHGFKGSAIIQATFWEHEVFDNNGFFLRNLLGLGAVNIERSGTRLGEDIPGDEAAGSRGIPFKQDDILEFCFLGPDTPICPGQPVFDFGPLCPSSLEVAGDPNDLPILDNQTVEDTLNISVDGECLITDANLELRITHTFMGDLVVNLINDDTGTTGGMFAAICGGTDNFAGTLDDDAMAAVTTLCGQTTITNFAQTAGGGLNSFDDTPARGQWRITIQDTFGADQGFLNEWKVILGTEAPAEE